jgi:hypothetical protein
MAELLKESGKEEDYRMASRAADIRSTPMPRRLTVAMVKDNWAPMSAFTR